MPKRPTLVYETSLDDRHKAVVCQLKGKLIGRAATFDCLEELRDDLSDGYRHLVLELGGLTLVNSTGVGVLAALYTSTHNKGGRLVLVGVEEYLQRILEVVQIWNMVDKADSIGAALAGLP